MKYHYFHGRFTYSVKRSGRAADGVGPSGLWCRPPLSFPFGVEE